MGQALRLFLVIHLAVASSFITYYLVTTEIFHECSTHEKLQSDPIIGIPEKLKSKEEISKASLSFHVAVTASHSVYERWQCRIMYYWYKKKKGLHMGGFTRILHSTKPDKFMDEIPTFLVDPLPPGSDRGYVVLNRPWAFVQWLEKATIVEEYVLMAEPDHIFLKPLPNLADGKHPVAFPFSYIEPSKHTKIISKFYYKKDTAVSLEDIDPIGNSPVIIRKDVLKMIAPTWMKVALKMKEDPETDKAFGWVLEMYAYAIASALHDVWHILRKDFMIQPPSDYGANNNYILHYTYGLIYNLKGELIQGNHKSEGATNVDELQGNNSEWRFNKRLYRLQPPPRNISLPPPGVPKSVMNLIQMINEATANIPNWEKT